ncbi:hypothetical protein [Gloeocapsopsis dulcis]
MVQAGGMHFHHPEYVRQAKALCEKYDCALNNCGINRNVMPTPRTIG